MSYKDQLKTMGGKWNSSKKAWIFTLKEQQQLLDLFQLTENEIGSETQTQTVSPKITIMKTLSRKGLWVTGPTMPYKDQLKALDGKWNPSRKSWILNLKYQTELLDLFQLTENDIGSETDIND